MSLNKVNYVNGVTVITAQNMNDIQDAIVALESEGGSGVTSVNGKTGVVVLTASDVGAGTYSKPSGGIPKSDLASAVQTSLGKADTALQSVPSSYRTATAQDLIDQAQNTSIAAKYTKPSGGIPVSDLASAVQTSLEKADTALQSGDVTEPLIVTYAISSMSPPISTTCDKTYAQIADALSNKTPIVGIVSFAGMINILTISTFLLDPNSGTISAYTLLQGGISAQISHKSDDTCRADISTIATESIQVGDDEPVTSNAVYRAFAGLYSGLYDPTDVGKFLVVGSNGEIMLNAFAPILSVNGHWEQEVTLDADDVGAIGAPTNPSSGQFLVYDGTRWVAQTVPSANGVNF